MNWTPEQVAAAERRIAVNKVRVPLPPIPRDHVAAVLEASARPTREIYRSKWEGLFRDELEMRRLAGEVVWYGYELIRLQLASFTQDGKVKTIRYTPDFAALEFDVDDIIPELVLYEVKGFWREAARVRIKLAASQFPFRFIAVTRSKGEWLTEVFTQ